MNDKENAQNSEEVTSMRGIDATVIGHLRTEKIGRPLLVVELLVIFLVVIGALPFITTMLNDESSSLYLFLHGGVAPVVDDPSDNKVKYDDASTPHSLSVQTNMKFDNLIIKKVYVMSDKITMNLSSYNGVLNLDEKEYYLEIYSSGASDKPTSVVKLTGTYDNVEKSVDFRSSGMSFNSNLSYIGKVVEMKDSDYPEVTVPSDESGIGSFTCTMNNRSIEYVFKNNYLIGIKDNLTVKISDQETENDYLNLKKNYDTKAELLKDHATSEETEEGFVFSAEFDLDNYTVPEEVVDYDYYKSNVEAKIIQYAQKGKGFDCE